MSQSDACQQALLEKAFCESILAKGGLSVLSETFAGISEINAWDHYPSGDIYDPESGAQWFYHCHPATDDSPEHGHFHCFVRPQGTQGPIHHLIALGVNAEGQLLRLFTVNQWVVGDDWCEAAPSIALLSRFDVQMPQPNYLVNRWLTAVVAGYQPQIESLLLERDLILAQHQPPEGIETRQDRALEVTSELWL